MENTAEVVLSLPQERPRPLVAKETTLNIARSQPVQEQARVQQIPELQVTERVQDQIVLERIE